MKRSTGCWRTTSPRLNSVGSLHPLGLDAVRDLGCPPRWARPRTLTLIPIINRLLDLPLPDFQGALSLRQRLHSKGLDFDEQRLVDCTDGVLCLLDMQWHELRKYQTWDCFDRLFRKLTNTFVLPYGDLLASVRWGNCAAGQVPA